MSTRACDRRYFAVLGPFLFGARFGAQQRKRVGKATSRRLSDPISRELAVWSLTTPQGDPIMLSHRI